MFAIREQRTHTNKQLYSNMMKQQDILILLKKMTSDGSTMSIRGLANSIGMSVSSISASLERCKKAHLIDQNKKRVNVMALKDFLTYGVQYVFPAEIGNIVRGVPTYISASPIKEQLAESRDYYVWRSAKGTARGQQITPLYLSVPNAVLKDDELYQLLVIVDTLRVGSARERAIALQELTKRIDRYANNQQ